MTVQCMVALAIGAVVIVICCVQLIKSIKLENPNAASKRTLLIMTLASSIFLIIWFLNPLIRFPCEVSIIVNSLPLLMLSVTALVFTETLDKVRKMLESVEDETPNGALLATRLVGYTHMGVIVIETILLEVYDNLALVLMHITMLHVFTGFIVGCNVRTIMGVKKNLGTVASRIKEATLESDYSVKSEVEQRVLRMLERNQPRLNRLLVSIVIVGLVTVAFNVTNMSHVIWILSHTEAGFCSEPSHMLLLMDLHIGYWIYPILILIYTCTKKNNQKMPSIPSSRRNVRSIGSSKSLSPSLLVPANRISAESKETKTAKQAMSSRSSLQTQLSNSKISGQTQTPSVAYMTSIRQGITGGISQKAIPSVLRSMRLDKVTEGYVTPKQNKVLKGSQRNNVFIRHNEIAQIAQDGTINAPVHVAINEREIINRRKDEGEKRKFEVTKA